MSVGKIIQTYYNLEEGNEVAVNTVCVHSFSLDTDHLDAVDSIIWDWAQTELGKFVVAHSIEGIKINRVNCVDTFNVRVFLTAKLTGENTTYFLLKLS